MILGSSLGPLTSFLPGPNLGAARAGTVPCLAPHVSRGAPSPPVLVPGGLLPSPRRQNSKTNFPAKGPCPPLPGLSPSFLALLNVCKAHSHLCSPISFVPPKAPRQGGQPVRKLDQRGERLAQAQPQITPSTAPSACQVRNGSENQKARLVVRDFYYLARIIIILPMTVS